MYVCLYVGFCVCLLQRIQFASQSDPADRLSLPWQTFEGHSHYVMYVLFNPKDTNTFASASLDRTIKVFALPFSPPSPPPPPPPSSLCLSTPSGVSLTHAYSLTHTHSLPLFPPPYLFNTPLLSVSLSPLISFHTIVSGAIFFFLLRFLLFFSSFFSP